MENSWPAVRMLGGSHEQGHWPSQQMSAGEKKKKAAEMPTFPIPDS